MSIPFNFTSPYLPTSIVLPENEEERRVRIASYLTEISLKVNQRGISRFDNAELPTGEIWFGTSPSFRKSFKFGAIPQGTTLNILHNVIGIVQLVRIFGSIITTVPDFRGLPYVDAINVTNQVSAIVNGPNIVIVSGAAAQAITSGIITIEYLKN